jgi:hypothetical protein
MSGSACLVETRLLRKADAARKVLESRVGTESVKPQIGLEKVRDIGGFSSSTFQLQTR